MNDRPELPPGWRLWQRHDGLWLANTGTAHCGPSTNWGDREAAVSKAWAIFRRLHREWAEWIAAHSISSAEDEITAARQGSV